MSAFFVSIVSTFFFLPLPLALGRGGTTRGGTTRGGITLAGGGTPGIIVCLDVVCFGTNGERVTGGTGAGLYVVSFGPLAGGLSPLAGGGGC